MKLLSLVNVIRHWRETDTLHCPFRFPASWWIRQPGGACWWKVSMSGTTSKVARTLCHGRPNRVVGRVGCLHEEVFILWMVKAEHAQRAGCRATTTRTWYVTFTPLRRRLCFSRLVCSVDWAAFIWTILWIAFSYASSGRQGVKFPGASLR